MRTRTRARFIALVAGLTLVTAGCGNSDGGGDAEGDAGGGTEKTAVSEKDRPYVDALKQSMKDSSDDADEIQLSDDQINCVAPLFVGVIGADRLAKNGVTPADFASEESMDFSKLKISDKEGNALYDTLGDCDVNLRESFMASLAADEDMTPAAKTCMEEAFTDDNLRLMIVSTMVKGEGAMEDDPELGPLMGQLMTCAFMGIADEG